MMSTLVEMDNKMFAITLSIGVSDINCDPADNGIEQIVQRADQALYAAKQAGRNRTVIFHQE
jgi:diguanylate cyclase (GGDEF)-like protein